MNLNISEISFLKYWSRIPERKNVAFWTLKLLAMFQWSELITEARHEFLMGSI